MNIRFKNVKTRMGGYISCRSFSGLEIARLTYCYGKARKRLVITCLKVEESFKGKGCAQALIGRCIELAKNAGVKIYPYCNYARDILEYVTIPNRNQNLLTIRSQEF